MIKMLLTAAVLLVVATNVQAQTDPVITSWIRNTTSATGYAGIPANVQVVQYSAGYVYVSCTGVPGYTIGPWPMNPNVASNQNFVFKIIRTPQQNTGTATAVGLGHVGLWANGVSIFNADDGQTYNNQGVWHRNAYYWEKAGFDACLGHPQQQGEYHHHVSPTCLYNDADNTHHSPIIGWAWDGYPVYGAYAYTNTDGTGPIKRMTSSYQLRNITQRTTLPDGSPAASAGPAISTQYPLGAYLQDYEFITGLGDLDDHNGRFCKTPEFPNGTYAYFVTIDAVRTPVYPYTLGATYYGIVPPGSTGPTSGHATITESTTVYTGATTGMGTLQQDIDIQIAPNPVNNYLAVYFGPSGANNVAGTVVNAVGRTMQQLANLQPGVSYNIDCRAWPEGMYFLNLNSGNRKLTKTFVVQH